MDYFTGDLGAGGAAQCAVQLQFHGRLGEAFTSFALRRANRLSLRGWIDASEVGSTTIVVEGPEALVDAFELACSLGPIDSDVESWTRTGRATGINSQTFDRRR
jgi:acylphosphatase